MTGTSHGAAMISLPRSQVEMSPRDLEWQEKITKVVKRVAKDLIATDEAEISEVVRHAFSKTSGRRKPGRRLPKPTPTGASSAARNCPRSGRR